MSEEGLRYELLADELGGLITSQVFRPGERLPSVRRLAQEKRLSISTVVHALRLLEERGTVEARPQSGYFVRTSGMAPLSTPPIKAPALACKVNISSRMMSVLALNHRPDLVPFGCALPSAEILPVASLQRLYSQVGKRADRLLATTASHTALSLPDLVRQFVRLSLRWGQPLDAEELIVTNSCTEALSLCLRTVTQPGDTVAVESPAYPLMLQLLENMGLKALEIPTHPQHGMSVDALDLATRERKVAACLLVSNFSNPLGCVVPDADKARLARMMAERNIPIIEDDIFGDLNFGPLRPWPIKSFDKTGNVMLCSSVSKTMSPALRLGYVAAGRYYDRVLIQKTLNVGATNPFTQSVAAAFMESGAYERHLRSLRRAYQRQVLCMSEAVTRYFPAGTRLSQPQGGFVLWVELPEKVDTNLLYDLAVAEGVAFFPGELFSASGRYRNCLRLSCGCPWSAVQQEAVQRLGRLTNRLLGQA